MEKIEGVVQHYNLIDWWLTKFTFAERKYIENKIGTNNGLIYGKIISVSIPASQYLGGLETWFSDEKDAIIKKKIHDKVIELGCTSPVTKPGYYGGRHYTTYIDELKELKKNENYEEVEALLIGLLKAIEEENNENNIGVPPWYYEQLAIIYRKQKNIDKEIKILERYAKQKPANHWTTEQLHQRLLTDGLFVRLEKAKMMKAKSG